MVYVLLIIIRWQTSLALLLTLHCRSEASLQCIQQRTQEPLINGFQTMQVSRFRNWEYCPCGRMQIAAHVLTRFPPSAEDI